jgi:UDP-glucose 4-epimerase
MKIVITGGNGYIGARLCNYLAGKRKQIIPVCFPSTPIDEVWKNKMSAIIEGDLRHDKTIAKIVELDPDVIIHLVSLDHFDSEKEPGLVNNINVLPTWRLLDACTKTGLKKFIYFSTIQVYGKFPDKLIDELQPVKTVNIYGLTHLLSEQICEHYNRKATTNIISVRLSNSYGEPIFRDNNCWLLAINDLCKTAFLQKKIHLISDGSPQRDFIHGNDVCQAVNILIDTNIKSVENNVYHISSGQTVTLLELAKTIRDVYQNRYGHLLPISTPDKIITGFETPKNNNRYQISNEKIKRLGFSPDYNIGSGINSLFNYLEDIHGRT